MTIVLDFPPRPSWFSYYWSCVKYFGEGCYRAWREELFSAIIFMVIAYFISIGVDTKAWDDLQIAFLSSGIGLAVFALWHLIRAPFLAHANATVGNPNDPPPAYGYGILGILVLLAMAVGGGLLGERIYAALPKYS